MVFVEPAFPRGRNVETEEDDKPRWKRERHNNYGVWSREDEKERRPRPKERRRALFDEKEEEEDEQERALRADNLCFRTLQEGMLVLACVSRILKSSLEIAMPGRLHGEVPNSSISVAYSEQLKTMEQRKGTTRYCTPLSDFYSKGDLLYVKVMSKCKGKAICSLNPTDLHSEFVASQIVPGLILAATISAKEDHGYLMETGIRNVRAFLPEGNLNENSTTVGKNLFCSVEKVIQRSEQGALLILRAFKESERRKLDVAVINIDQLVPGCIIPFTVGTPVRNGLRGTLFDDTVSAFVNQNMLKTPKCKPEEYTLFKQMDVTLLYVYPVTKQVFVSMVRYANNKVPDGQNMPQGSKIENAHVVSVTKYGVWFSFLDSRRAFLSKSIIVKGLERGCNYEDTVLSGKYHEGSVHTLYVIRYDVLDRSYIVCDKMENASEETKSSNDIHVGRTYIGKIVKMENAGLQVTVGQVEGLVPKHFLDPKTAIKEGATIRLVAVTNSTFTNHVKFRRKDAKILRGWYQIQPSPDKPLTFDGLVVEDKPDHFVVAFFNDMRGIMYKSPHKYEAQQDQEKLRQLSCGSIERFTVHQFDKTNQTLILSLPGNMKWIEMVTVTVKAIHPTKVEVVDTTNQQEGVIPLELFSVFHDHKLPYLNLLKEGQELNTVKLCAGIYSVRDVRYFQYKPFLAEQVKKGDILRASCYTEKEEHYMNLLLIDYDQRYKVSLPEDTKRNFPAGSIMMVEIKEIEHETWGIKFLKSYRLNDVCKLGVENVFLYMTDYLDDWISLVERYKQQGDSFAKFNIAQMVDCTIEEVGEESEMIVRVHDPSNLECTAKGIALKARPSKIRLPIAYNVGDRLPGRVVWVDVEQKLLRVCIDPPIVQRIGENRWNFSDRPMQYRSVDVLFRNEYVKVCCTNGPLDKFPLVLVPNRCHYNDMRKQEPLSDKISVHVAKQFGPFLFGLEKKDFELFNSFAKQPMNFGTKINIQAGNKEKVSKDNDAEQSGGKTLAKSDTKSKSKLKKKKKSANAKKQLLSQDKLEKKGETNGKKKTNQVASVKENGKKVDRIVKLKKKKKQQKKSPSFPTIDQLDGCDSDLFTIEQLDGAGTDVQAEGKAATKRKASSSRKEGKGLPGATNFWDSTPVYKQPQSDSSEDENSDDERNQAGAKKRLTAKERFEIIKQEEDRLRKIEEELANPSTDPHTPDQFDRLVLAQPNNSMLWIRYMVFHMESAELDKARAVGRKALKTINFREEAELLNVWMALLNLEIRYETVDSFKEVLQEAIQYNDAFKVYSRVLDILIDCKKDTEVRELLELLQKKFRKQNDMWYLAADAWYRIGHGGKAKPLLSQALKSLPNRDHIPLIVKFAFLHNRHGNRDEAHLLFEQILTSYPKRTDIWSQYVDMLVKDGLVENARQILERAVVQRLPLKNMKTLYTKYVNFEEKHGNRDSVRRVKQMATDYVQGQLNNAGIASK
ncbi:AGAP003595-PA-like protein [Anopheles sinensis]|uniref:AGAP003595-PA-like protein n=1 Tax=Anopheles sinensis TaxID=74873 RepID=A0A084VHA1_ANOSI|nr:AGAP003595-PA-like protein [Anopheles sinensis]